MNLTTLTRCNGFHRAFFSDGTSLIIHENDALGLSKAHNIRIEDEDSSGELCNCPISSVRPFDHMPGCELRKTFIKSRSLKA